MREQGAAAPVFILYVKCIRAAYEQLHSLCHPGAACLQNGALQDFFSFIFA